MTDGGERAPLRVIVADDQRVVREGLTLMLGLIDGIEPVGAAADGEEALASAGSGYGVSGMRERAELIGGRLLAGPTEDGFRVELWVPA